MLFTLVLGCTSEDLDADGTVGPGQGVNKIYGGSAPDQWYHDAVVSLHNRSSTTGSITRTPFCTGTLLTDSVVLTAAHCVTSGSSTTSASRIAVYVGEDPRTDLSSHDYLVSSVNRHSSYSSSTMYYDMAILELSSPVTESVTPVPALPNSLALTSADVGTTLNFAGFGYEEDGTYGYKMQVDLTLGGMGCTVDGCSGSGSSTLQFSYEQDGGYGPCSGDSGGPAFVDRSGTIYVAGTTSYGDAACTRYGVSAHAAPVESWIADFTGTTTTDTADTGGTTTVSPCSGYESEYTGSLSATGDYDYQPGGTSFSAATGYHYALLDGPSTADFDVYLYKYNSRRRTWSTVASGTGTSADETVSYYGTSGTYEWLVYSYSGSGSYTFCMTSP